MSGKSLGSAKYWGPGGLAMTPGDRAIFREDINQFLPEHIFDMHTHVYPGCPGYRPRISLGFVKDFQKMVFPQRICNDLIVPIPHQKQTADEANQYAYRQMCKLGQKQDAMLIFIEPGMSPEYGRQEILRTGAVGYKVYMTRATAKDRTEASIRTFLPEKHIKVMDEMGLMVLLHLSKAKAISDPGNIRDVENLSRRYPNSKWVLAHCARCFRPGLLEKVVDRLNACPNVYIECSAVCDPLVFMTLYKYFDRSRLMFGSDNVFAGGKRGRYVELGLFWDMIGHPGFQWGRKQPFKIHPTFVIYEQLRAMSRAAKWVQLSKKDIRDIFWNNAIALMNNIRR